MASPVVRDHARFSFPHAIDARGVAGELAHALTTSFVGASIAEAVRGEKDRASFGCRIDSHVHRYSVERVAAAGTLSTAYRDADPRSVWLLVALNREPQSLRFHEVLVAAGAGDVRWFSSDEWAQNRPGQPYPLRAES